MELMHQPCPCGTSSDAYCTYDDGHSWCYSCNKGFYPKEYHKKAEDYTLLRDTNFRGIEQKVADLYGIETYGEKDRVLYRVYLFPDEKKRQIRRVGDKAFKIVGGSLPSLGGDWLFNAGCAHYITVVEGREDAAAAYQMLNTGKTLYPVVWLQSATIAKKDRDAVYRYLSSFETVKLAIEDDEGGKAVKQLLSEMLPNKIREVQLTKHKDANDYLMHGHEQEFKNSWTNAGVYTPDNIFHTEKDIKGILNDDQTESFVPTNFKKLNELIKGLPMNHVTLITAMEGMGKTELLRAFEYCVLKAGEPVAIMHFEETKNTTVRGLASYELEENVRRSEDKKKVLDAYKSLTKEYANAFLFEFKNEPTVETILEQVNYLVYVCGVKYIFIDPINQFDPVDPGQNKVEFLDTLCKKLEKYCASNPVGLVWTAHVDDEGRTRNSRMISKACSIRIDLKRDHMAADEDDRNRLDLLVTKNRPFGETGFAGSLTFDKPSFMVVDGPSDETGPVKEMRKKDVIPF